MVLEFYRVLSNRDDTYWQVNNRTSKAAEFTAKFVTGARKALHGAANMRGGMAPGRNGLGSARHTGRMRGNGRIR